MILEMTIEEAWGSIEHLFKEQFIETEDADKYDFNPDISVFEAVEEQGRLRTFVAMEEDEAIGYYMVATYPHPHKDVVTAREECFYVKPEYRGQGVCTELFSKVEEWLRDQEVEIFFVTVKFGQTDSLITKLGFEPEETVYKKYL